MKKKNMAEDENQNNENVEEHTNIKFKKKK